MAAATAPVVPPTITTSTSYATGMSRADSFTTSEVNAGAEQNEMATAINTGAKAERLFICELLVVQRE
jgi:hypothetical protein